MIGLKRGTVKLVEHNPEWKRSFKREAEKLEKILGQDIFDIQYVGSLDNAVFQKSVAKIKKL